MKSSIFKRNNRYCIILDFGKDIMGKRKTKWYSGFKTRKEAEERLITIKYEIQSNTFADPNDMTVSDYLKSWLEDYVKVNLAENTIAGYEVNLKKHVIPYIGQIKLQKLQPITIQKLYSTLLSSGRKDGKGGLSAKSVVYVHRNLKKALNHAYKMQIIQKNPADCVEVPRVKEYDATFLTENETVELLNLFSGTDIYLPVLLAVGLGLRRCEALGLRWQDIDFENKTLTINKLLTKKDDKYILTDPKTRKSKRTLALPDSILSVIKQHKENQDDTKKLLKGIYKDFDIINCRPDGTLMSTSTFGKKFAKTLKKNNFKHLRFHDLRHTNASLMLKYKIQPKVASENLGHSRIGVTFDIYTHLVRELHEEVALKFEENLFKKINPSKD